MLVPSGGPGRPRLATSPWPDGRSRRRRLQQGRRLQPLLEAVLGKTSRKTQKLGCFDSVKTHVPLTCLAIFLRRSPWHLTVAAITRLLAQSYASAMGIGTMRCVTFPARAPYLLSGRHGPQLAYALRICRIFSACHVSASTAESVSYIWPVGNRIAASMSYFLQICRKCAKIVTAVPFQ